MRGRMNAGPSYAAPVEVGQVMEGRAVCEVVSSNHPDYRAGDLAVAGTGWQEYALSDGKGVHRLDPGIRPMSYALGVLGMPGLTAYTGLLNIGKPQPGETLVVAAASSARSRRSRAAASSASPEASANAATRGRSSASMLAWITMSPTWPAG
jgi:NADPH-dependent curcumin reductase CurA